MSEAAFLESALRQSLRPVGPLEHELVRRIAASIARTDGGDDLYRATEQLREQQQWRTQQNQLDEAGVRELCHSYFAAP